MTENLTPPATEQRIEPVPQVASAGVWIEGSSLIHSVSVADAESPRDPVVVMEEALSATHEQRRRGQNRFMLPGNLVGTTPDWAVPMLSRVVPTLPERQAIRLPEAKLCEAIVFDAHERCKHVASLLGRISRGFQYKRVHAKALADLHVEEAELRAWLTDESHGLHSLGWCCDVLEVTSGHPWRRQSVADAMLAILDDRETEHAFQKRHRAGAGQMAVRDMDGVRERALQSKRRGRAATRVAA